jgi:hypothetical protein
MVTLTMPQINVWLKSKMITMKKYMKLKYFLIFTIFGLFISNPLFSNSNGFDIELSKVTQPMQLLVHRDKVYITDAACFSGGDCIHKYSAADASYKFAFGKEGGGSKQFPLDRGRQAPIIYADDEKLVISSISRLSFFNFNGDFEKEFRTKNISQVFIPFGDKFITSKTIIKKEEYTNNKNCIRKLCLYVLDSEKTENTPGSSSRKKLQEVENINFCSFNKLAGGTSINDTTALSSIHVPPIGFAVQVYKSKLYIARTTGKDNVELDPGKFIIEVYDKDNIYEKNADGSIKAIKPVNTIQGKLEKVEVTKNYLENVKSFFTRGTIDEEKRKEKWNKLLKKKEGKAIVEIKKYSPAFHNMVIDEGKIYLFTYKQKKVGEILYTQYVILDMAGTKIEEDYIQLPYQEFLSMPLYTIKNGKFYAIYEKGVDSYLHKSDFKTSPKKMPADPVLDTSDHRGYVKEHFEKNSLYHPLMRGNICSQKS